MTVTATSKEQTDPFWTRVRMALDALRPVRQPAYGQAAIARSIGMKPKLGAMLEEELVSGWNGSALAKVSMSLLVVEIDRPNEFFTVYDKATTDRGVLAVMRTMAEQLPRPDDTCLRLGRSGFVAVLPDCPALTARALAVKIAEAVRKLGLSHREIHAGVVTVSIGLAVTNPSGGYDRKFFEAGAEAVKKAQRKGLGKLEMLDLRPALERKKQKRLKKAA